MPKGLKIGELMRLFLTFLYIGLLPQCFARWATFDDLSYEITNNETFVEVNKDGSYTEKNEISYKILKKEGIEALKFRQVTFDENISKVVITKAETVNNGVISPIDITKLTSKSLSEKDQGFNSYKAFKIGFHNLSIGTTVRYGYTRTTNKPSVLGHYSQRHVFGLYEFEKSSRTVVKSKIPINYFLNDNKKVLDVKKYEKDGHYFIELALKKPVLRLPVGEYFSSLVKEEVAFIDISTDDNWDFLTKRIEPQYRSVYEQKIPEEFQYILSNASKITSHKDKVTYTLSEIIKKITYIGYWNTSKGKLIPRDLSEIAKTMTGDCKDFTSLTVSLLKAQGIVSYPSPSL